MGDPWSVDSLERIVVAGVALTTAALGQAQPGLELTLSQWRVLAVLVVRAEPLSLTAVAGAIAVTLPATSRQVHRLADRGLIALSPNLRDRRSLEVSLTPAGRDLHASVITFRRSRLAEIVDTIDVTPAVERALAQVADALDPGSRR
ncbi:MAG: MarR family transcriptional regulator [Candidatus Limnocylindrales bacterium]